MIMRITEDNSLGEMEQILTQELEGQQLWGDIDVSLGEYEALKYQLNKKANYRNSDIVQLAKAYPVCFTTLLVFLARYKYDTNYWGLLSKELSTTINGPIESELGAIAKKAFRENGFDFSDVQNERRINLEPIFYEAGLPPESSLDDLFYILKYDTHDIFDPLLIIEDLTEMRSYQIRKPLLKFLKRFKEDRAVEFIAEIHEAILCVDQGMANDSTYCVLYADWKEHEQITDNTVSKKKQTFQTKPYLYFDNEKRGLCLILPRMLLRDKWADSWIITTNDSTIRREPNVCGEEGKLYIESLTVPVPPSPDYHVTLIEGDDLDTTELESWDIAGIRDNGFVLFNAHGRLISPKYLPMPNGVLISGCDITLSDTKNINLPVLTYPTDHPGYNIRSIEPTSQNSAITIRSPQNKVVLISRPQVELSFIGNTLFSLGNTTGRVLFTEIPRLVIQLNEDTSTTGLLLRIGSETLSIQDRFSGEKAEIQLDCLKKEVFTRYGIYSIRLYQNNHFLKQAEFCLVPNIQSDYSPNIAWIDKHHLRKPLYRFKKTPDVQLTFEDCKIFEDASEYNVECPLGMGAIPVRMTYSSEHATFETSFEIPVRPFEIDLLDSNGNVKDHLTGRTTRVGLSELTKNTIWISVRFFGLYRYEKYRIKLRTINGVEQQEPLSINHNGCGNFSLSVFYDTLHNVPLPARIELLREDSDDIAFPLIQVADTIHFRNRPTYTSSRYISINAEDDGRDITVVRFRHPDEQFRLMYKNSVLSKSGKYRGYKCPSKLTDGFYIIECDDGDFAFEFEEESLPWITHDTDTIYVSSREKDAAIGTLSDWLDQLMKDILSNNTNMGFENCVSYRLLSNLHQFMGVNISPLDYERLIALVYFLHSKKCSNAKLRSIKQCVDQISDYILDADSRLEMIRLLSEWQNPPEIVESCIHNYGLYLFTTNSDDALMLADCIDHSSTELSLLLRMGGNGHIKDTILREKSRNLIGKDAISSFLGVPDAVQPNEKLEEQKRFLREQPSLVSITIDPELSGKSEYLFEMANTARKEITLNVAAKPNVGIYFGHTRYFDLYVDWFVKNTTADMVVLEKTQDAIRSVLRNYGRDTVDYIKQLRKTETANSIVSKYLDALKSRYNYRYDPMENLNVCIPARFFYIQALAAFLAKLPTGKPEYKNAIKVGEQFMIRALRIAPQLAKRDILMASTYIYLSMKEESLCQ